MTQLPSSSTGGAPRITFTAAIALCLVALQIVTTLHFALVPHGFSAGLNGFVHVHAAAAAAPTHRLADAQLGLEMRARGSPAIATGGASCASDSCPIGFAGHHSVLLGASGASALLLVVLAPPPARSNLVSAAPKSVLLTAPKTSPPV